MEVVPASRAEIPEVRSLLPACGLSADDVDGQGAQRFLVVRRGGAMVGCIGLGVRDLYLLTTTVRERALRDGFVDVAREAVPGAIREGTQFRSLCPASASCLRLHLQ